VPEAVYLLLETLISERRASDWRLLFITSTFDSLLGLILLNNFSEVDDLMLRLSILLFLLERVELVALNFLGAGLQDPTALGSYSLH